MDGRIACTSIGEGNRQIKNRKMGGDSEDEWEREREREGDYFSDTTSSFYS